MALRTGDLLMSVFKRSEDWKDMQGEKLDHLKHEMQSIMDDVVNLCERYDLTYILAYGSALGAIRHNGFIPWDDDVDLCMPRKDYNRFLEIAPKELGENYFVRSVSRGDHIAVPSCHVKKKGTRYINFADLITLKDEPEETKGIYIDVFPLENASEYAIVRKIDGYINLALQFVISSIMLRDSLKALNKKGVKLTTEERKAFRFKITIATLFSFFSTARWFKLFDKYAQKNHNNHSKYVTSLSGYKNIKKSTYLREKVCQTKMAVFEGKQYRVPIDSNYYLKVIYGDYMKIPDVNHRKVHPVFELHFSDGTKL